MKTPASQLEDLLGKIRKTDGGHFSEREIHSFSLYYRLILKWNRRLHLTTITQPQAFIERHLCESEFAAARLAPAADQLWDLGTGPGIPGIPIAILTPDLTVHLVESSRSKAIFLEEAVSELKLSRARVVAERIESLGNFPAGSALTARAVEKMEDLIPRIVRAGAESAQILLFGTGQNELSIRQLLSESMALTAYPLPGSDQRVLFVIDRRKSG
ncbi:MAG TPA: 16S rRNA (guanine(527)-N(7))-methyltransferase RsmG [Blastocatellia bacterium]|nr:16S rRNA (guanine(527)-N(7))-methyltransferase RsmG [Blastocatellia bacterium]